MKFSSLFRIPSYMTDNRKRLKAASVLEITQELAGQGASRLGFGDERLGDINAVWVLARVHVHFARTAHKDDEVELQTWHKGLQGIQFLRDYQIISMQDKEPFVQATSSWLIMDVTERRILHGDSLKDIVPAEPQCDEDAIKEPCGKISLPKGRTLQEAGVHTVSYSDVDYNGHTNNTKYIQWALDVLPSELVFDHDLSDFEINYNKESHPHETVRLLSGSYDGDWYVEGRLEDGQPCFIARFHFQ